MKTNNLLLWKTKSFLITIFSIQISILGLICLDILGISIPIFRPFIGFIYLTFVPGILILRIFRFYKLSVVETVVYSVGLSIATIMSIGFFMNFIYPLFGIFKPLAITPLILTISIIISILSILSFISDKRSTYKFHKLDKINIKKFLSPASGLLYIIFFINIFGVFLVNFHNINVITLISLLLISMIPLLIAFNKIPKNLYPLSIFIISISLLFHISLISMFLYGRDAFNEFFIANIAFQNSYWSIGIQDHVNSILSITILPVIYSNICNIGLEWVFKIVFPFIFSLVPLVLYLIYKEQTDDKIAFMACFFFMSIISFYYEMPQLLRQEIALLFFSLLLLLILTRNISGTKKSILLIIFSIALIQSHYGLSYIFAFFLFSLWLILTLKDNYKPCFSKNNFKNSRNLVSINSSLITFFIVLLFAWYILTTQGSVFESIVRIGDNIISNLSTDFLNPDKSQALAVASKSKSLVTLQIITILTLISQFFISIGVLSVVFDRVFDKKKWKYSYEFIILSFFNFLFWIFAVSIPYFSSILTANRLYQITLIVLSPYFVIGGFYLLRIFKKVKPVKIQNYFKILSIFLIVCFYFNVGIMGFITGDKISMALDSSADWPKANEQELSGIHWLMSYKDAISRIFADIYKWPVIGGFYWNKTIPFSKNPKYSYGTSYIYLGSLNVKTGTGLISGGRFSNGEYLTLNYIIDNRNKIYDNNGSAIYKK